MNNILTLPQLAELLSSITGYDVQVCKDFVIDFSSVVIESLADGEQVRVKGMGTFTVTRSMAGVRVVFTPDKELAERINAPFVAFEPVELSADIDEAEFDEAEPSAVDETPQAPAAEDLPELPSEAGAPVQEDLPPELPAGSAGDEASAEEPVPEDTEDTGTSLPADESDTSTEPPLVPEEEAGTGADTQYTPDYEEDEPKKKLTVPIWLTIVIAMAGIAIGWGTGRYISKEKDAGIPTDAELPSAVAEEIPADSVVVDAEVAAVVDTVAPADTLNVAPGTWAVEEPSKPAADEAQEEEVYEVATAKRFLTYMARDHYGHKDYWVYIYLENKAKIKDPNNIPTDLRVKIPPRSKYDVSTDEAENLKHARHLIWEVQTELSKKKK